jgi:hypothetical protein
MISLSHSSSVRFCRERRDQLSSVHSLSFARLTALSALVAALLAAEAGLIGRRCGSFSLSLLRPLALMILDLLLCPRRIYGGIFFLGPALSIVRASFGNPARLILDFFFALALQTFFLLLRPTDLIHRLSPAAEGQNTTSADVPWTTMPSGRGAWSFGLS